MMYWGATHGQPETRAAPTSPQGICGWHEAPDYGQPEMRAAPTSPQGICGWHDAPAPPIPDIGVLHASIIAT